MLNAKNYLDGLIQLMPKLVKEEYSYVTGASENEIESLQKVFPLCPAILISLLEEVNGTYYQKYGEYMVTLPILGSDINEYPYYLKSVEQIIADTEKSYHQESIYERYGDWIDKGFVEIDKKIDSSIQMKEWLCFSDCVNNGGTSSLYIDFKPTEYGKVGQVIRYIHDPDSYSVLAESFEEYLIKIRNNNYSFAVVYEDWQ